MDTRFPHRNRGSRLGPKDQNAGVRELRCLDFLVSRTYSARGSLVTNAWTRTKRIALLRRMVGEPSGKFECTSVKLGNAKRKLPARWGGRWQVAGITALASTRPGTNELLLVLQVATVNRVRTIASRDGALRIT